MEDIKKYKEQQRECTKGEPSCSVCGRYAEYICSITEEDICSLECKHSNLLKKNLKPLHNPNLSYESYLHPSILNNITHLPSKEELDIMPAVLYKNDIVLIAPSCNQRLLCFIIPLIQRISITAKASFI